ncbi:HAD family phosphatase [Pediococcus pentosaceus]|uniref:Cof-type HAD-IIB family hydrolase n=1 Tax=Pediococcus pentosaceus TaxID=1255 RepID=UPI0018FE087C|nr:HAD family hydrolase [Pediococcus pentosaceus]MBF7115856.1 HAD family phosphatase [Pediococcus pentosaceus]
MIKLIVSDLDETLVGPDGNVSEENIEAIKKATQKGVKFVPNTGRGFESVQPLLETLGLKGKANEFVISYNGGVIVENQNFDVIQANAFSFEQATQIFDITKQHLENSTHIYTLNDVYVFNEVEEDNEYIRSRGVRTIRFEHDNLDTLKDEPIFKIITMNPDFNKRKQIKAEVLDKVNFDVNATFSSDRYTEFNLKGVDKGQATLELGRHLGIKTDEIMALGDNNNDVAMLKSVGLPVVVSNASASAKANAKYIAKGNYETGVAEAINKFVLGE